MGRCLGYCAGKADTEEYRFCIRCAEMIFNGKSSELKAELEKEMQIASDELRYERAAEMRDRLHAIEGLSNRQAVIGAIGSDTDAVGFFREAKSCFSILHYMGANLTEKEFELLEEPLENDSEAISALVRQYYSIRGAWPKTLLLPFETEDMAEIEQQLSEASGHRVYIEVPQRGEKRLMTEKAMLNAKEECLRFTTALQRRLKALEWLQNAIGLETLPERIEAFDISNTGNFGIAASMVVFVCGKPLKRDYRKFRIKGRTSQDDFGSMREALTRRFMRCLNGDKSFVIPPDLLLVDGGAAHASVAERVLRELGIILPVLGMVKDDKHRTRALVYANGKEVGITGNPAVFALISSIQEETHRFAIEYHRKLRNASIVSQLEEIEGVGKIRRNELLKRFKTIKAIKAASYDELCTAVPKNAAKAVYDHFHKVGGVANKAEETPEPRDAGEL
jgi:excinuclease ABC subunit C